MPNNYTISQSIDGFEISYPKNPNNNSLTGKIVLEQTESKKTCQVNITQQANPIYKFKGLVMRNGLSASFSDPDTYMGFDINTRYFDYPGNGNELIIAERGKDPISFKSFSIYCSRVNNFGLFTPQSMSAWDDTDYHGSKVIYENIVNAYDLQFGLPWGSGTWEAVQFYLESGYYIQLKQK